MKTFEPTYDIRGNFKGYKQTPDYLAYIEQQNQQKILDKKFEDVKNNVEITKKNFEKKINQVKEGKFTIIRHGATRYNNNDKEKLRGWLDLPLIEEGKEQAKKLGDTLVNKGIDGIIASDLIRTKQTAEIISQQIKSPILKFTPELRPWNLGVLSGQEIEKVLPQIESYAKQANEIVPEGESFNQFKNRFLTAIQNLKNEYPNQHIALVFHHRNERLLNAWLDAGTPADFSVDLDTMLQKGIPPASAMEIPYSDLKKNPVALPGSSGMDGHTPTQEELLNLIKPLIPAPLPGKDGYTPIKGKDYFDGLPGKDGQSIAGPAGKNATIDEEKLLKSLLAKIQIKDIPKLDETLRELSSKIMLGGMRGGQGSWKQQQLSGAINGSNKVFTFTGDPAAEFSERIFLNYTEQNPFTDYTINGTTVTYTTAPDASLSGKPHIIRFM